LVGAAGATLGALGVAVTCAEFALSPVEFVAETT
jgi:hypothetical protein